MSPPTPAQCTATAAAKYLALCGYISSFNLVLSVKLLGPFWLNAQLQTDDIFSRKFILLLPPQASRLNGQLSNPLLCRWKFFLQKVHLVIFHLRRAFSKLWNLGSETPFCDVMSVWPLGCKNTLAAQVIPTSHEPFVWILTKQKLSAQRENILKDNLDSCGTWMTKSEEPSGLTDKWAPTPNLLCTGLWRPSLSI